MGHDFKNSAEGVSGLEDLVDLFFHTLLGLRVGTVKKNLLLIEEGTNLFPRDLIVQRNSAGGDDVTEDFDAEFAQEKLGDRAERDASGGFAGGGALENIASFGKVVLQGS